ncbi:MAG: hypothetical protein ACMG6S_34475 [Byssovorax sp.]
MKTRLVLVSLLATLAPLTSACGQTTPIDVLPHEAVAVGALSVPGSAVEAPESHAKKAASAQSRLFPRQATPFGTSYEAWAAAWWQWALAIPKDQNPILGGPCELNQSGDVFFLAGTAGGSETRSCTIPAGKGIFFPIVNVVVRSCPEYGDQVEGYSCEVATDEGMLHQWATEWMGSDQTLLLEIDGSSVDALDAYRAHSDAFTDTSPLDVSERFAPFCSGPIEANSCGVPVGSARPAVADGIWAMLHPLSVGPHEIRFAASVNQPGGGFSIDVTYNIVVAP